MTRELLSAEDARILALESGTVRGHTCKVIVLDGERGADQIRAHLDERLSAVPRLRCRLDPADGPPAWEADPDFSLERHVVERGPLDDDGLRRLVCTAMETQLDRDRPLWAMDVVSPLASGRTALVWRIHHALADGVTAMRMARELLLEADAGDAGADARSPSVPAGAGADARSPGVPGDAGADARSPSVPGDAGADARSPSVPAGADAQKLRAKNADLQAGTGAEAAPARSAGRTHPPPDRRRVLADGVRRAARVPRTLRQELGPGAIRSPLDRPVGPRREVAFIDASLDELRRIGHAMPERTTVNDVALSAVGAGLRAWLDHLGAPAEGLRAKVPVSLHRSGEPDTANRDSFMFVDLPLEQDDPLERLAAVSQ
jgi:diacylglycerol O-acyltransferase / wax synthase